MNFFKKKNVEKTIEKKSVDPNLAALINFAVNSYNKKLNAKAALEYYDFVSPVASAIDTITDELMAIEPVLVTKTKDEEQSTNDSPILAFLQQPNADMTIEEFMQSVSNYFLITGEAFIIATGDVSKEPAEIIPVSPACVGDVKRDSDGFVRYYKLTLQNGSEIVFRRDDRQYRFYNANKTAELWHIKDYNTSYDGRGLSKLNAIKNEIDQYSQSSLHNISLLNNGMRPSAFINVPDNLSQEQLDSFVEQVRRFYSGSDNAGKALISFGDAKFQEASVSNKDMDFAKMRDDVTKAIYLRYKIPLPLMSTDSMTFSNFETSQLALYDRAIIPLSRRLFKELTLFLGERFKLKTNQFIEPNLNDITALQQRTFEHLKVRKEIGVETIDEMRTLLQREPLESGGNFVYLSATMAPIGADSFTDDNIQRGDRSEDKPKQPVKPVEEDNAEDVSKAEFIDILRKQIDDKGVRLYTDNEIAELATKAGYV